MRIDVAEMLEIGDRINFVHRMDIKGEKKIMKGKIKKILEKKCVLIEVINDNSRKSYNGTLCNRNIADIV
jgi:predicted RNA-binding protein